MIQSTEIKPGQCFIWEGNLYQCLDKSLNKTAMAKMKVALKVKDPRTGVVKELGLIGSDRVEEASIDKREMQYLYDDGDLSIFMDLETYDQIPINARELSDSFKFVKENEVVKVLSYKGKIFGIEPPNFVVLKVTKTDPGFKGNTATNTLKPATLETGAEIRVPLFIDEGEEIRIDTRTGEYMERA